MTTDLPICARSPDKGALIDALPPKRITSRMPSTTDFAGADVVGVSLRLYPTIGVCGKRPEAGTCIRALSDRGLYSGWAPMPYGKHGRGAARRTCYTVGGNQKHGLAALQFFTRFLPSSLY